MSEYQLIELIFLAALAGYLIYRLYIVLGQSDEEGRGPGKKPGNVVPLRPAAAMREEVKIKTNKPKNPALEEVLKADPSFDEEHFKQGAEYAFKMIVEAYAKGDIKDVKDFLSKKVYDAFSSVLEKRKSKGEVVETEVIAVETLDIVASSVSRGAVKITVQIESDQATTVKDSNGNDLYPEDDEIERASDRWTFRRRLDSTDPNWTLHEIHEVSDEKANGQ